MIDNKKHNDYKTELERNGVLAFAPGGNSMWPTLKDKKQTVMIVKKQDGQRFNKYDVALYQRKDGSYVIHRIMEVLDNGYNFMGDSLLDLEFVPETAVLGLMTGFNKGKKFIEVTDKKYIKRYTRYFKRKRLRKIRLKFFFFRVAVKNKLKRIFNRG